MPPRFLLISICLFGTLATTGCRKASPQTAKSKRPEVKAVQVEIGPDGLARIPGSTTPFSGEGIDIHTEHKPKTIAKRTPYLAGLKHGAVTTFTPGGKLREERTYKEGKPVSSIVYHGNGKKKIQVQLNGKDLAEGPYHRWYDNGVLESECVFDANERFNGEEKTYDRDGKLIGHYRHQAGNLVEIIFETLEMKQTRLARMAPTPVSPASAK